MPCSPPRDLPYPEVKLGSIWSPALAGRFFITSSTWESPKIKKKKRWEYTFGRKNKKLVLRVLNLKHLSEDVIQKVGYLRVDLRFKLKARCLNLRFISE